MRTNKLVIACFLFLTTLVGYSVINPMNALANPPFKGKQKIKNKGHAPPPHAPAHGHRYKHQHGVELNFDSLFGAYVVVKMPGVYFHNGLYMKISTGQWLVATHFNSSWRLATKGEVPYKLKKAKGIKPSKRIKTQGKNKGKRGTSVNK